MTNVEEQLHPAPSLHLNNLTVVAALGRGAKGVVFLVRSPEEDGEFLALKTVMKKSLWESTSSRSRRRNNRSYGGNGFPDSISSSSGGGGGGYRRVSFEEDVLALLDHPLLPKLRGVLETDRLVGYAIDYCPGGDLNSLRKKQTEKMFSHDAIRFYAAEIVLALEYLHGIGVVYRDLKPENVMIQENGHIMLVDFDLSTKLSTECRWSGKSTSPELRPAKSMTARRGKKKKGIFSPLSLFCRSGIVTESDSVHPVEISSNSSSRLDWDFIGKSNSFVGTEDYLAPEVIAGKGHDFSVDWWCFGVMLYEMLYGTTPFRGSDRRETYYRILVKAPELVGETTPLRDLIRKLLEKDPKNRISLEGIKKHEFFENIDWDKLPRISRPPFIPKAEDSRRNLQIDLESFVYEVFQVQDDDEKLPSKNIEDEGVWVDGLNNQHAKKEDFFVF